MNNYVISSFIAFVLLGLGLSAALVGIINYNENKESKSGANMLYLLFCTFIWNFGYAWMSLCYNSDFAYIARAIALLGVSFYCFFIMRYISSLVGYKPKFLNLYYVIFAIASVGSWYFIIQKSAVTFQVTAWGYWYVSKITWARIVQFVTAFATTVVFYYIVIVGIKKTKLKRYKYVYKNYLWFGPILYAGYMADTIIPSIFHIPAIPGSSIGAFFSTMLLFKLSRDYRGFGISKDNISEYVFQDVDVPVIIADCDDKITLYNDYVLEFFKNSDENIFGMTVEQFFASCVKAENDILVWQSDEKRVEFKLTKTEVNDRFGELLYTVIFIQDITKEQENLRALEESRQEAEAANMAKSSFLANMSHEIRTPMNAILGMSEIILQDNLDEEIANEVTEIKVAAKNLLGIINDILDISKIEAGKYEIIPDYYELSSLLNDVSSIIRIRVQEINTKFVLDIDSSMPENIYGDQLRIRQLLLNLLGNAVKFTKNGTITLKTWWNNSRDNTEIYFDIIDTGIGIHKDNLETIFGEFNQVDTRRNRSVQGTGLGLAISRNLARLMGGDITVESEYGKGSIFHVVIKQTVSDFCPIGEQVCDSLARGSYTVEQSDTSKFEIKRPNAKVLIVDDVEMNLIIAQGLLKKYDIDADIAPGGRKAVEMVTVKDYDLIFMDHMMPEIDGVDTTKLIRKIPKELDRNTVVIALTANAIGEAKDMLLEAGMQDFLAKPIDPNELDQIILKWLR